MAEPYELSVGEAAAQVRSRGLSAVGLMGSLIGRSRALEPALNVWVTLDEDGAMGAAARSDADLARRGPRGPLHGVPVGVKDIFYTRGTRTTGGSPIYADFVPEYDATAVALLKRAGAIVMGKTVTTEFACMDPPPTRNPWNPAHTPGGSSSGSAVGVAARMFPAALGSQTAGSVLRPAAYNGVVGLKPTFGRISRRGVMPVASSMDTVGFFTRTVADAAIMLGALAGDDPEDPAAADAPVPDYERAMGVEASPPRIGVVRQIFFARATPEVRQGVEGAVEELAGGGASVVEVVVEGDFEDLLAAHRVIMSVEAASVHEAEFRARPGDYGPKLGHMLEEGLSTGAVSYLRAQGVRERFRLAMEEAASGVDILVTPSTPAPAPRDLSTTGDPVFQTPWTACGLPSLSLPLGLSASGLPLGLQLAAAPFAEEALLAAALWCEQVVGVSLTPPVGR
jgi:aspartyl-tRNA(Asn)/glutamyl-tRNA(Gln) amidotransferase subunit A